MTTITLNGHKTIIPSTWNEFSKKHILAIAEMMQTAIPEYEFKVKALLMFTGWKLKVAGEYFKIKAGKNEYLIESWQVLEMVEKLGFLFREIETKQGKVMQVNARNSVNTIPFFRHRIRKYYGPADRLYNLTFGEYLTADNYFSRYVETKKPEFLNKLVATLYRRKDANYNPDSYDTRGDKREPFNAHNVERRAEKFKNLPLNLKLAVVLFFNGCKIHLSEMFTEVFSGSGGGKSKFGGLSLITALNDGDVSKSKLIREQYLYDVMVHLDTTARAHREFKERGK